MKYPEVNRELIDEFRKIVGGIPIIYCKEALKKTNGNFNAAIDYIKIIYPNLRVRYGNPPIYKYTITIEWENNPKCTRTKIVTTEYRQIDTAIYKCLIDYEHENISKIIEEEL